MNIEKVRQVIKFYKDNLDEIDKLEKYKWQAVKCFQDNWSNTSISFYERLESSLAKTKNLLDAGNYFPHRMILEISKQFPNDVESLLNMLFDDDSGIGERCSAFKQGFDKLKELSEQSGKQFGKHYQDDHAITVYLTLRFPDTYYIYKYGVFKSFCELVAYNFSPTPNKMNNVENLNHFFSLAGLLRAEIEEDRELVSAHFARLTTNEYYDESLNLLTQDVIYSAVEHQERFNTEVVATEGRNFLTFKQLSYIVEDIVPTLKGSFTNYSEREKDNKRVGDLGELSVLGNEQEKLKRSGSRLEPVHISKKEGDGIGYDILSYDEEGREMYIEVKNTTSGVSAPFFITGNELHCSKIHPDKYFLYRLYNYDKNLNVADFDVISGSLEEYCINPVRFRCKIKPASDSA